ncbi:hypothetical protein AB4393_17085 [Vibrio splendidus]|uniref:Uncharacterized protein n=1 Tax=Vibrio splendidus TaxID=29497 RepID=A0A2N7FBC5_VIBSP|nr:hypothetical protein [Vibrio splendidus]PMH10151.1 hypothetical protein BCU75_10935 [Vibrio splendidus]PMJ65748.1 hypothetical protein BCU17_19900 [Vibrio splendidus]
MIADVEVLKKTFQYLKNYLENNAESDKFNLLRDTVPAESKIGFAYMKVKGHELSRIDTLNVEYAYRLMLEEMEIFEVDKLVPIEIKSSVAGVFSCYERFVTIDTKLQLRYHRNISDLKPLTKLNIFSYRVKNKLNRMIHS